jgi:uncharacterized protein (TIGR04255 family)
MTNTMPEPSSNKHYPKAPIIEAVIDLRVELTSKVVDDLKKVHNGEEVAYPTIESMNVVTGQMQLGPQMIGSTSTEHRGFLFRSADGKLIHQARLDGFTISRLAPYPRWEDFRAEAFRLWNIYRSVAQPSNIVRVAVRYVNRIDIPLPVNDFGDYLRTVPQVSPTLPQGLLGYFMQLVMPLEDFKSQAVIIETLIEPTTPNIVSVVLDIDIFRTADLPSDEAALWALIEQLRNAKNRVFEGCITDKARELFQ